MDYPAISAFFADRKSAWLKKNTKASISDAEIKALELECETQFSLANWLPNAASRAWQMAISTHPCTFSHPSARKNKNGYVSSIIANSKKANDGFLRSGNVSVAADALGNAAALDVYKFLTLTLADGNTLIDHLERDSEQAINILAAANKDIYPDYQALKQAFLAMTTTSSESITSSKIKQVYFPLNVGTLDATDYHQLSLLTASGVVFELRQRLDALRFGDAVKEAREKKKNNQLHSGYKEIYNLTTIGYGGTKQQNISVLNNQNAGKAHLLMSLPPSIKNRDTHFPKQDFFSQTLRYSQCKNQFQSLHPLYRGDENNMHIRAQRDAYYQSVIDHIIEKMWQVRAVAQEQYRSEDNQLPAAQQTWLCEHSKAFRETTDDWLDAICSSVTSYLFHGYEKTMGNKAIKLGDGEYRHIQTIVLSNKEVLR
jgi:CRISPR-associated protein Csy1